MKNKQIKLWKVRELDNGKKTRKLTKTYTYSNREELVNVYEQLRKAYNVGITRYGKGRQRYQLLPAGQKTYSYLEKQVKMMARRLGTGIYEQTGGEFQKAFIDAISDSVERFGSSVSVELEVLLAIFESMHHTQFAAFYNSLNQVDRSIYFDTSDYYDSNESNATKYAKDTLKKLVEFAKDNPKVRDILDSVALDYGIKL